MSGYDDVIIDVTAHFPPASLLTSSILDIIIHNEEAKIVTFNKCICEMTENTLAQESAVR